MHFLATCWPIAHCDRARVDGKRAIEESSQSPVSYTPSLLSAALFTNLEKEEIIAVFGFDNQISPDWLQPNSRCTEFMHYRPPKFGWWISSESDHFACALVIRTRIAPAQTLVPLTNALMAAKLRASRANRPTIKQLPDWAEANVPRMLRSRHSMQRKRS